LILAGAIVDPGHFATTPGSTIIELSEAFLHTLADGDHMFRTVFEGGFANVGLTVARATPSPQQDSDLNLTSANRNRARLTRTGIATPVGILVLTVTGAAFLVTRRRSNLR
jgi:hypothetical protein